MAFATFAAGCFWHVEEAFRVIIGVKSTKAGYTGGKTKKPTYEQVCTDTTGHAEAVLIEYDPATVPYKKLLDVFFVIHDPTQVDRQGPDEGTQYRSAIFYHDENQRKAAEKALKEEQRKHDKPIATKIVPAGEFYKAEDYHQQYLMKRGRKTCGI
ncbi:peptide-methionine (S)-S-oxide reductase MsrA [Candidatus Woesearchaeota archaeon]|nr:peptide-methionine (S)-S-oxide reductase MsrA [Candidatus Woesearchaeota archaeon]